MRGKPYRPSFGACPLRSIPACAGETRLGTRHLRSTRVHPRLCGGNLVNLVSVPPHDGPSPPVRGKQDALDALHKMERSIPACAGETVSEQSAAIMVEVHPRLCGGNLKPNRSPVCPPGPSPPVRGKHEASGASGSSSGSIPACAGETRSLLASPSRSAVHPRLCGGNIAVARELGPDEGPSPPVRGKPLESNSKGSLTCGAFQLRRPCESTARFSSYNIQAVIFDQVLRGFSQRQHSLPLGGLRSGPGHHNRALAVV